jgi:ribosomal protein S12 methylthiotransferase
VSNSSLVSLIHLGCARNLIDSELILGRMAEQGLVITDDPQSAHTVVLNTCSFIGPAREESERAITDLLDSKQRGEIQGVVVAGCLVQRYKKKLRERFPAVDLFAEISDYAALARGVRSLVDGNRVPGYLEAGGLRDGEQEGARLLATPRSYAYLRISHGCDHTCSFCAIPSIRGPHRSKRLSAVVAEAQDLLSGGVRELVLVAEDATAWGRDLTGPESASAKKAGRTLELPDLVEALAELDGLHSVRVMYAYPNRFPWRLTELLRDHPRVAPYLDIPIQHAATPVLRAMRRAGSGDQVRATLDRLLEEVPGITLRTTLLMGFPGETDADAAEAVKLVEDYNLHRLGAFTYSIEEGTSSFELADRVSDEVADSRYRAVLEARDRNLEAFQGGFIGQELEVVIDEAAMGTRPAVGRTAMDAPEVDMLAVLPDASEISVGDVLRVRVESLDPEFNLVCRTTDGQG